MLNAKRMGIAAGIVLGVLTLILTLLGLFMGHGLAFLGILASLYPMYSVTLPGAVIGLLYGFFLGFIIFYFIAHVYESIDV